MDIKDISILILHNNIKCNNLGYDYPRFSSKATLHFVAWSVSQSKSYAWFKKLQPALRSLEISIGRKESCIPPTVGSGCGGMMRKLAATKVRIVLNYKSYIFTSKTDLFAYLD